jgi:CDP-diacylglycerol---glycerol-3-phosphate 3-phosphatidyltransferase
MAKPAFGPNAIVTPANGVTLVRMAATPFMLGLISQRNFDFSTLGIWIVLCGTDGIDGILARRYGVTRSGAFLDPLADKFLILGAMLVLAFKHVFSWPLVIIICIRDIGMSVYRSVVARKGVSIPARKSAKAKTFVQQTAVGVAIAPWIGKHATWLGAVLLVAAAILTVVSGVQYFLDARNPKNSAKAKAATSSQS